MRMQVYSVRDNAVGAFLAPFFFRARGEAIRAFEAAVMDNNHQFAKNADDYTMYFLGEFDDNAGMLVPLANPERVISALELLGPDRVDSDIIELRASGNGSKPS